jgi:hypothetical protein
MQTTAAPSLPVSSFTIARCHVKFIPSFDIIISTGFSKTMFSYSFEYLLQTRHFDTRLIENTYGIRWKIGKCEHRSFSLASWERTISFGWCLLTRSHRQCNNPSLDVSLNFWLRLRLSAILQYTYVCMHVARILPPARLMFFWFF